MSQIYAPDESKLFDAVFSRLAAIGHGAFVHVDGVYLFPGNSILEGRYNGVGPMLSKPLWPKIHSYLGDRAPHSHVDEIVHFSTVEDLVAAVSDENAFTALKNGDREAFFAVLYHAGIKAEKAAPDLPAIQLYTRE